MFKGYTKEEVVARGKEIYREQIQSLVEPQEKGKFVVIDIKSGDYEIAAEHMAATDRLLERRPDSVRYVGRIGFPTPYKMVSVRVRERRPRQEDPPA